MMTRWMTVVRVILWIVELGIQPLQLLFSLHLQVNPTRPMLSSTIPSMYYSDVVQVQDTIKWYKVTHIVFRFGHTF